MNRAPFDLGINPQLQIVFERVMKRLEADQRCLGAWHYGSISRRMQDQWSDVDPMVLVEGSAMDAVAKDLENILRESCNQVWIIWPESFNNDHFRCYGCLLELAGEPFLFDICLSNSHSQNEFMCRAHRQGCTKEHIIFEKDDCLQSLLGKEIPDPPVQQNVLWLIDKYWLHGFMLKKYFARNDRFKLVFISQMLFHTHLDLLFTHYPKPTWGGWESQVKHGLPKDKQEQLLGYFCDPDPKVLQRTLRRCLDGFGQDARQICEIHQFPYPNTLEQRVKYFLHLN